MLCVIQESCQMALVFHDANLQKKVEVKKQKSKKVVFCVKFLYFVQEGGVLWCCV